MFPPQQRNKQIVFIFFLKNTEEFEEFSSTNWAEPRHHLTLRNIIAGDLDKTNRFYLIDRQGGTHKSLLNNHIAVVVLKEAKKEKKEKLRRVAISGDCLERRNSFRCRATRSRRRKMKCFIYKHIVSFYTIARLLPFRLSSPSCPLLCLIIRSKLVASLWSTSSGDLGGRKGEGGKGFQNFCFSFSFFISSSIFGLANHFHEWIDLYFTSSAPTSLGGKKGTTTTNTWANNVVLSLIPTLFTLNLQMMLLLLPFTVFFICGMFGHFLFPFFLRRKFPSSSWMSLVCQTNISLAQVVAAGVSHLERHHHHTMMQWPPRDVFKPQWWWIIMCALPRKSAKAIFTLNRCHLFWEKKQKLFFFLSFSFFIFHF